jgi:hypothetical protein
MRSRARWRARSGPAGRWWSRTGTGTRSYPALVRRLVAAYADWQQAWMAHADGWMGRRLRGVFQAADAFDGVVHARVLTTTEYAPAWFGYENAQAFGSLARRGLVPVHDCARSIEEQARLAAEDRYFHAIAGFAYVRTRRVASDRPSVARHRRHGGRLDGRARRGYASPPRRPRPAARRRRDAGRAGGRAGGRVDGRAGAALAPRRRRQLPRGGVGATRHAAGVTVTRSTAARPLVRGQAHRAPPHAPRVGRLRPPVRRAR